MDNTHTDPRPEPETTGPAPVYWFNPADGALYLEESQLPARTGDLYLVVDRGQLFFGEFSLQAGNRVKDAHLLNIQGHFIPFKNDFTNIIYSGDTRGKEQRFLFWVGALNVNVESYFYDEIPESLLFKGDPAKIQNYNFFLFRRVSGYELIYLDFDRGGFYSVFETDPESLPRQLLMLRRKFALKPGDPLRILSDIDLPLPPGSRLNGTLDLIGSDNQRHFFLPDHFPLRKKFSNISQNKQVRSIRQIARQWHRNLTIIALLLLLVILVNGAAFLFLKKDNQKLRDQFDRVNRLVERAEFKEFQLNKIKKRLGQFPDHMLNLDTIARSMDLDSRLISYSQAEGRIIIEGYSPASLDILERLRKTGQFKDVRFKTTVTKSSLSQEERFEIEILLYPPGEAPPPPKNETGNEAKQDENKQNEAKQEENKQNENKQEG